MADFSCLSLCHFIIVAAFAIHDLRPFRSVTGFKFVRTRVCAVKMRCGVVIDAVLRFCSGAGASAIPEFQRISLCEPLMMAAIRTQERQRKLKFSIKRKFL